MFSFRKSQGGTLFSELLKKMVFLSSLGEELVKNHYTTRHHNSNKKKGKLDVCLCHVFASFKNVDTDFFFATGMREKKKK
jgi:hypothetical protein